MSPTLREGDEVLLETATSLTIGDVVVARVPTRSGTVLHRVIEADTGRVVTRGDACRRSDPPVPRAHVLFRATALRRAGLEAPIPGAPWPPMRRRFTDPS